MEMERLEIYSRKLETPRDRLYKDRHNKRQKCYGHKEAEDVKNRWQEYIEELYKMIFTTQIITMV